MNELVELGVVAVVTAGNKGYNFKSENESPFSLFGSISDPGNAELAITVGSTHGRDPQEYGVSFFSSRGPTMDGRLKPDLLAPGEKVVSCSIDLEPMDRKRRKRGRSRPRASAMQASYRTMDGTAMAAAHVSGAIALLLSARPELIGHPQDVKRLLMETATDLKRVPWAQGHGLVDTVSLIARARERSETIVAPRVRVQAKQPILGSTAVKTVLPGGPSTPAITAEGGKRFVFGLSYPGTHRDLVTDVVYKLRPSALLTKEQILFDRYHEAELARPDLNAYLPNLYRTQCELVVVFLGGGYGQSKWCGLEWKAVRDVINDGAGQNIMLLRLDSAKVPGLKWTDGAMEVSNRDPEEIAAKIFERFQLNRQQAGRT